MRYDSDIHAVLNIFSPSLVTNRKILITSMNYLAALAYPAVAPLKFKFVGFPSV